MEIRLPRTFYASPMRGTVRPVPTRKSTQGLRPVTPPVPASGILLSTGLEHTHRESRNGNARVSSTSQLIAPLNFLSFRISDEAKKNPVIFPFDIPEPVAVTAIQATAPAAGASAVQKETPVVAGVSWAERIEEIASAIAENS